MLFTSRSRPINDLDDVRTAMSSLKDIREAQIRIDMTIGPIEESYALLNRFELYFDDGNSERVDGLAYQWRNLIAQVNLFNFAEFLIFWGIMFCRFIRKVMSGLSSVPNPTVLRVFRLFCRIWPKTKINNSVPKFTTLNLSVV